MKIFYIIVAIAGVAAGIIIPQYDIDKKLAAKYLGVLLIVAVGIMELFRRDKDSIIKKKLEEKMKDREALTNEEFGEKYFNGEASQIAITVRQAIEKLMPYDVSKIHPNDKFIDDLYIEYFDDMAPVEIIEEIEAHYRIKFTNKEAERIFTIKDFVEAIKEKVVA